MGVLTAISIGLSILGTAANMYATDTAAKQEASNLKFQAAQGEADAKAAQGAAIVEAERIRKASKMQRAQATAAAAASGVDVSSPTAVRIDEEITANAEEDALLTIMDGKDRSTRLNQQAAIDRTSAKTVRSNAKLANVGTLLSGASSAYGKWQAAGSPMYFGKQKGKG